jgi:hypothetical protein
MPPLSSTRFTKITHWISEQPIMNLFSSELDDVQFLLLISIEDSDFFETGVVTNAALFESIQLMLSIHGGRV